MIAFGISRLINAVLTFLAAALITFVMIRIAPGDPVMMLLGDLASNDQIAEARAAYGLDRSLPEQMGLYLWRAFQLDFGASIIQGIPALTMVLERLPMTALLAFSTFLLVTLVSIPLGLMAAWWEGRWFDRGVSTTNFVVLAMPEFWVGLILSLIFARWLQWAPSFGSDSLGALVLPAITLALPFIAVNTRLMRNESITVLNSAMVQMLQAKGVPTRRILFGHVLRNAAMPVLTVGGVQLANLLGGAVIVEIVFGWPGIGALLISSISFRDYPVVQTAIMVITLMVIIVNLAVDLAYRAIDPRLKRE